MIMGDELAEYNRFCKALSEGTILYNLDSTNLWGDYLLVVNKCSVTVNDCKTYTVLLIGMKRVKDNFTFRNLRIKLTPEYAANIPYLKYVGMCNFLLVPDIYDVKVNQALIATYEDSDIYKYNKKLGGHRPRRHKYDKDGNPVLKSIKNNN
jgi:hypothetical protein